MKIKWKKVLAGALSVVFITGNVLPSNAANSGWKKEDSGWQYLEEGKNNQSDSWKKVKENWYHFDSKGYMQTGWFQDTDGKWYFLDYHTGAMKTGWIKPADGKWYFLDYHTGAMKTGWIKPADGKWYYLDKNSGAMQTGWVQENQKWYYLDSSSGAMQTGRVTIQGIAWTLQADGAWDGADGVTVTDNISWVSSGSSSSNSDSKKPLPAFSVDKKTGNVTIYKSGSYSASTFGIDQIQNLTIAEQVGDGNLILDGLTVNGTTTIKGGGENTVHFINCNLRIVVAAKRLTEGKKPLHISFEGNTKISEEVRATTGKVKITIQENIVIPKVTTDVATEIKGAGSVDTLKITASIQVALSVQVRQLRVDSTDIRPEVNMKSDIKVSEVAGVGAIYIKLTGKGTVTGYYPVTLDANGGYWIVKDFDESEREESQLPVKVKLDQTIGATLKNGEIPLPKREGMEFNGWYSSKNTDPSKRVKVDITFCDRPMNLYAGWINAEDIVAVKTANIIGMGYIEERLTAEANSDATGVLTYQWYSCDTKDGEYQPIEGETIEEYRPDSSMKGRYIKVEISSNHTEKGVFSEAIEIIDSGVGMPEIKGIIKTAKISGTNKATYTLHATIEWEGEEGNSGNCEWYSSDQIDGDYQIITTDRFNNSQPSYKIREEDAGKYIKVRLESLNTWESEPILISEEVPLIVKEVQAQIVVTGAAVELKSRPVFTADERGRVTFTVVASPSAITVDQETGQLVGPESVVCLEDIEVTGTTNKGVNGTYVWETPSCEVKERGTYQLYFIPEVSEGEEEKKIVIDVSIDVEFPPDYDIDVDIDVDIDIDIDIE